MTAGVLGRVCLVVAAVAVTGGCSGERERDGGLTTEAPHESVVFKHEQIEVFDAEGRPVAPATGENLPQGDTPEELLRDAAE